MARLAAQLYTVRDFTGTEEGFADVLRMCHGIGYEGVQLSAIGCMNGDAPTVNAARARELLDENGLVCCATHRPWNRLVDNLDEEIEFHKTLGCDYVAIGGIWDYGQDADAYRRFLKDAQPVIAGLKEAGIRFGYHNHSHEFIRDPETGRPCYEILIEEGAPDLMLEVDTYWVAHAGADPAALLRRLAGRVPVIHVKDMEVVPKEGGVMAPVGEGNLNWDAILSAANEAGVEWHAVEQDICRRDPFDCLDSSYRFLSER
ncbi:sugar phosphate isomerase/epimerase family protein [Fimbriimonas ginsengisoli]|uniref:Xylose isomerase domain-containing protein n=1 Tax=Fimbriimonas ginsengisoli Gsoil 348 TaxID=661478 RepID=A0A068NQL9_FIMGI|nr:sugar phosphate isomerase/epimerase [Fimbriimonas ginsengisoli]AIE83899.1 xylose isomerase domain-containing protein [Fimbriimonas ginsengisoli Gsoil 348]